MVCGAGGGGDKGKTIVSTKLVSVDTMMEWEMKFGKLFTLIISLNSVTDVGVTELSVTELRFRCIIAQYLTHIEVKVIKVGAYLLSINKALKGYYCIWYQWRLHLFRGVTELSCIFHTASKGNNSIKIWSILTKFVQISRLFCRECIRKNVLSNFSSVVLLPFSRGQHFTTM